MAVRHKCFISYHHDDQAEVDKFIKTYDEKHDVFIARAVGAMSDDIINSSDTDYVMRRIRELYLTDSTVTIVLMGKCTWARRYVDWEIASTLRNDTNNRRSGLLGILLPSAPKGYTVPPRFDDNWSPSNKSTYAHLYHYPQSTSALESWIQDAFDARLDTERVKNINNTRELFKYNRSC